MQSTLAATWTVAVLLNAAAPVRAAESESAPAAPSLQALLAPTAVEQVQLSPDGKHVAMLVHASDHSELLVLSRETRAVLARISQRTEDYIEGFLWATDERLVLSQGQRFAGSESIVATGELYAVNADGRQGKYLFGYRGESQGGSNLQRVVATRASAFVLGERADTKNRLLVAISAWQTSGEAPFAKLVRLHIGSGTQASEGYAPVRHVSGALSDHAEVLRYIWGSESDRQQKLYYRAGADADWQLVNDQSQSGRSIEPLAFNRAGDQVYARIDDGKAAAIFARIAPDSGKETVMYRGKGASVGDVVLTADRRDVFALRTWDGRGGYAFIDGKSPEAQLTKGVMAQFPGEQVIADSFDRSGQFATVLVHSDSNPGEYLLASGSTLVPLAKRYEGFQPEQLGTTEPFEFEARDGLQLHGLLTRPPQAHDGPLPMVVLPHGGPYGVVDRWGYDTEAQLLATRGYLVLQLNFRGSGGYGQRFANAGVGEWGGKMQHDLTDATRWAIAQKHADPERICIAGTSYGAYAALYGAATEPSLYRCAAGISGVYDLGLLKKRGDVRRSALGRDYLDEILEKDADWLDARSPVHLAKDIRAAVLLAHGGTDERAPPVHAERMRDALTEVGHPPEWIFEQREGHGFRDPENRMRLYSGLLSFLDTHIGSGHTSN